MNLTELENIVGKIDRGQLAGSFDQESKSGAIGKERVLINPDSSMRVRPPLDDLSYMNPSLTKFAKHAGRKGGMGSARKRKRLK